MSVNRKIEIKKELKIHSEMKPFLKKKILRKDLKAATDVECLISAAVVLVFEGPYCKSSIVTNRALGTTRGPLTTDVRWDRELLNP